MIKNSSGEVLNFSKQNHILPPLPRHNRKFSSAERMSAYSNLCVKEALEARIAALEFEARTEAEREAFNDR